MEDDAERRYHALGAQVAAALSVALVVLLGVRVSAPLGFHAAVLSAWALRLAAALVLRRSGPRSPAYAAAAALVDLGSLSVVFALVLVGGTAATGLWLFAFAHAFVWHPRSAERLRAALGALVVAHAGLAVAFLVRGHPADATFTLLVLCACLLSHTSSARAVRRVAELRAESAALEARLVDANLQERRERFARDLHDGLGAELTALLLRLRREAREGSDPRAAELAAATQEILDELRGVVWSLRNEQGTLAELGKLVDASCRRLVGPLAYARTTPAAAARRAVGAGAAVAILSAARGAVAELARAPGVTAVALRLFVDDDLVLHVDGLRDDAIVAAEAVRVPLGAPGADVRAPG